MGEKEKKICHEMHIIITLLFNEIQTNVIQILFIPHTNCQMPIFNLNSANRVVYLLIDLCLTPIL
jgi:hypothetical protein